MPLDHLAKFKLAKAKKLAKLIIFDYDGTIYDGDKFNHSDAAELVFRVLRRGIAAAIITARAATALKLFLPEIVRFQLPITVPLFIAGGNGTILHRISADGSIKEIYKQGLSFPEIKKSIILIRNSYRRCRLNTAKLNKKGLKNFRSFLKQDWADLIPLWIMVLNVGQEGIIFAETVKVSFVLPRRQKERESLIDDIQAAAGPSFQVVAGDDLYGHLTKRLGEDSKFAAVQSIARLMGLENNQLITFGDMPLGNDRGLLSFVYSFTNTDVPANPPPYFLGRHKKSPTAAVYQAVNYLIS
jgi:hydroxymethylpyrimidine pyrophosphatase-like HAD family hydrolase